MDQERKEDRLHRRVITGCDAVLAMLLTWQSLDTLRPVTIIATGLALGVRTLASRARSSR